MPPPAAGRRLLPPRTRAALALAALLALAAAAVAVARPQYRQPFALVAAGVALAVLRWRLFRGSSLVPFAGRGLGGLLAGGRRRGGGGAKHKAA